MWERAGRAAKRAECVPSRHDDALPAFNSQRYIDLPRGKLPTLGKYRQKDQEFKSSNEASLEYLRLCLSNETKAQPTSLNNNPPKNLTNQPRKKLLVKKNIPFMYSINKFLWSQTYRQAKKYNSRSVSTFPQLREQTPPTLGVTNR